MGEHQLAKLAGESNPAPSRKITADKKKITSKQSVIKGNIYDDGSLDKEARVILET